MCIECLAKARYTLGQDDAVDAVLQIGMIATHMQLAVRILRHAGGLQQHIADIAEIPLWQIFNRLRTEHIGAAARHGAQIIAGLRKRMNDNMGDAVLRCIRWRVIGKRCGSDTECACSRNGYFCRPFHNAIHFAMRRVML